MGIEIKSHISCLTFENVSIVVAPVAFKEEPETAAEEAWERNGESVSHNNKRSQ